MTERFETDPESAGKRLDVFLAEIYTAHSRSYFQKLIREGRVKLNGECTKPAAILGDEDLVEADFPEPEPLRILPEEMPLDILYEDGSVILVNKGKNMVVHPAAGHMSGTLVNGLLWHCTDLSGINGVLRPGIVHRIDRDTTGIVIACKNDAAHLSIAAQLREHSITRAYYALVLGNLREDEGTVDAPIGRDPKDRKKMAVNEKGKSAVTHYRVLERFSSCTFIECRLETGRTHQIRVHMSHIGHPLAGDTVYGGGKFPFRTDGQCLHAYLLGFRHPEDGRYMEFRAPLPAYFENILARLGKNPR